LERFRICYLVSGVLFLIVSVAGGAWWELFLGEASKPVLYVGLSPFDFKAELLGLPFIAPSPIMTALFISERLLAILGSTTIIAGSLMQGKPWSRRLLNLRPLTMPVFFGALTIVGIITVTSLVQRFAPLVAQALPNLGEALMPYSGRYLTVNLYPLTGVSGSVKASTESRFTIQFWAAVLSGAFCSAGRIFSRRRAETAPPPPPPPPNLNP
jgi:hypothetical protein